MGRSSMLSAFPPPGLVWFWFLNSELRQDDWRGQLRRFKEARVKALVLHPREGMLEPYGGADWFELMRTMVDEIAAAGIQPWLYDEDPYPSGSASGRLVEENPEYQAYSMETFEAPETMQAGELFFFPTGKLVWAGALPPAGAQEQPLDWTARVGTLRRQWEAAPWDSRWYYPATKRYPCPRSRACHTEFALRVKQKPAGWRIVAVVARNVVGLDSCWGHYADSLNPDITDVWLKVTHERYKRVMGDRLGTVIPAIFTDEPKAYSVYPWTPGMFESFQQQFGYDVRPRIPWMMSDSEHPVVCQTRLHFRQWCGARFEQAWVKPVGAWCRQNNLALVGHISPEDDPLQQALYTGSLPPMWKHFSLSGIDVIIPAVGDAEHPILNVGVSCATASAQHNQQPGVMSETLGASSEESTSRGAAKVLAWQVCSGVNVLVVHGAFASKLGLRKWDAGPDYGPDGRFWQGAVETAMALEPFLPLTQDATQTAPVAIVWPIRHFQSHSLRWEHNDTEPRRSFNQLLLGCWEAQAGPHVVDEGVLAEGRWTDDALRIGRAAYKTVLIPPTSVLASQTVARLAELRQQGLQVVQFMGPTVMLDGNHKLTPQPRPDWQQLKVDDYRRWCREHLTPLVQVNCTAPADLRMTRWQKDGRTALLLMNLGDKPMDVTLESPSWRGSLKAGELAALVQKDGQWQEHARFDSQAVTPEAPVEPALPLTDWHVRVSGRGWEKLDRPKPAWELGLFPPRPQKLIHMSLTGVACVDGDPVADELAYSASVAMDQPGRKVIMVLEPTSQRGRFTIEVRGRSWQATLRDEDMHPTLIDLTEALIPGRNEIRFRIDKPQSLDGVKWPPLLRVE